MKSPILLSLAISAFSFFYVESASAITAGSLFTDHMVLQQKSPISVWGTAKPQEVITVTIAGRSAKGIADSEGHWKVSLRPLKAGGPHAMIITGNTETLRFDDVLVGEVWLCSGQSNMELPLVDVNNGKSETAEAAHPKLRFFTVVKAVSGRPETTCHGTWTPCAPTVASQFSAVGYFFGRDIQKALGDVPVGLIDSTWGGTPIEVWMSEEALRSNTSFAGALGSRDAMLKKPADPALDKKVEDWTRAAESAVLNGQFEGWFPGQPFSGGAHDPLLNTGLYNAMIHPLAPYALRGVIWYQGEANTGSGTLYRQLFPAMIQDWRKLWGQGDFPFLYVQLASFITDPKYPQMKTGWPLVQEAQLMTLSVKNTAMAVTIDIGDAKDIHPRNKQDVGGRLARAAEATVYGRRTPYSGPIYKSIKAQKNKCVLEFTHTHAGLVARNGVLKGFELCGDDHRYVPANAVVQGKHVVVWSDAVAAPTAVRYAWDDNPPATLFSGAGLPASPFRTDRDDTK